MSRRNFLLFIIILALLLGGFLTYFYFTAPKNNIVTEEPPSFLAKFNPFRNSPAPAPTPTSTAQNGEETEEETPSIPSVIKLKKISSIGVAGYGVFQKERLVELPDITPGSEEVTINSKVSAPKTEFVPAVRYVERSSGNIFQTFADKIDERKFSQTTIPKIYEALFGNKGQTVVMRYLKGDEKTIQTFVGTLPPEVIGEDTTPHEVKGVFLQENITDLSISQDSGKIFYVFNSGDSALGFTMDLKNSTKTQILSSPFTEWLSGWGGKVVTLTTKPSAQALGYVYAVDPVNKAFGRMFGGVPGLTSLISPDGKSILYGDSSLSLYILHLDSGAVQNTGLHTMPEKCIWNKNSTLIYCGVPVSPLQTSYPDIWYQGQVSFNDQLWSIDPIAGTTSLMLDIPNVLLDTSIDLIKPALDEGGKFLFFVNKIDSILWEYELN